MQLSKNILTSKDIQLHENIFSRGERGKKKDLLMVLLKN